MSSIINARFIYFAAAATISHIKSYSSNKCSLNGMKQNFNCDELRFMNASSVADYITCSQHNSGGDLIPVQALWHVRGETEQSKAAAFRATFGIALWAAALIHILGVEIYLRMTPVEALRLKIVFYDEQLTAGHKDPGSAGLCTGKLRDECFDLEIHLRNRGAVEVSGGKVEQTIDQVHSIDGSSHQVLKDYPSKTRLSLSFYSL